MIRTFTEQVFVRVCNNFNTAIVDASFPASTAFIEVGDFERFVFLIRVGTLNSEMTAQVRQAPAIDGVLKDVVGAVQVIGASDDNELYMIEVETRRLDINNGHNFVTLTMDGGAGGDDYLDILFLGINKGEYPPGLPTGTNVPVIVAG